jgi:ElaB/YqjD/DUF883 family membrane-anchored ribosome-binding protein
MANAKPAEDATTELKAELKSLRDDLAELVEHVKTMGKEQADAAMHSAKEAVDHATDRVRLTAAEARKRGEEAADDIEAMITRHPLTSIMVAVGLGYFVGRMRH